MVLLPPLLELTTGNPAARVLAPDDKYAESGDDKVINTPCPPTRRNNHVIENGITTFLEPDRQYPSDPGFSNIAPEAGRANKDDQ